MTNFSYSIIKISKRSLIFFLSFFLFFILSIVLPVSKVDPFSDLANYQRFWSDIYSSKINNEIFRYEPGFVIFSKIFSYLISFSEFLWLIKFLVFYSFLLLALKFYKNIFIVLLISLITFFIFPPFSSISNLVIRQGLSTALLFFYLSSIDIGRIKLNNILFLCIALPLFHYSAILVLLALVLLFYITGIYAFFIWCILNILYIFNIPGNIGLLLYAKMGLSINALDTVGSFSEFNYAVGFKPTFLFINIFFIAVPFIISFFGLLVIRTKDLFTLPIFRFYLILNSLCVFTSLMPFHDRFFIWSWVFGPLLIISTLNFSKYTVKLL